MDKLYTIPEAAAALRVTRAAVYKWIKEGRIAVVYVGSERRITQTAIDEFIKMSTKDRLDQDGTISHESRNPSLVAV